MKVQYAYSMHMNNVPQAHHTLNSKIECALIRIYEKFSLNTFDGNFSCVRLCTYMYMCVHGTCIWQHAYATCACKYYVWLSWKIWIHIHACRVCLTHPLHVPVATCMQVHNISLRPTDLPLIHSVARELEAMADPQPNVLNLASTIFPSSSTLICTQGLVSCSHVTGGLQQYMHIPTIGYRSATGSQKHTCTQNYSRIQTIGWLPWLQWPGVD